MLETNSTTSGERGNRKRGGAMVVLEVEVANEPVDVMEKKERKKKIEERRRN